MVKNRAVAFWILGSICLFFAMFAIRSASSESLLPAGIVGLILTLLGGLFWVSVSYLD